MCLPAQRAPSTGNCIAFLKTNSAASLHLWSVEPRRHMASAPLLQKLRRREPLPSDALHLRLCTEREKLSPASPESLGRTQTPSSCPGPLGKMLPGRGGGKLLFKSASISSSSLPAEQGDGEPRPDAIPFRSRPGNWPSCSCLQPGALYTGPSHCAGEGGKERTVSDAHCPPPPPHPLFPPTTTTDQPPPTPTTLAGHPNHSG